MAETTKQAGKDKAFLHTQLQRPRHEGSCKQLADSSHERRVKLTIDVPATTVIFWTDTLTRQRRTDPNGDIENASPHYTQDNSKIHIQVGYKRTQCEFYYIAPNSAKMRYGDPHSPIHIHGVVPQYKKI